MSILITGASGFLGKNLIQLLASKNNKIVGTLRNQDSLVGCATDKFEAVFTGDLSTNTNWRSFIGGIDIIIHTAALVHNPRVTDISEYMAINCGVTTHLAKEAINAGVKKFIYISTSHIYGQGESIPYIETSASRPQSPYAKSKLEAEKQLTNLFRNSKSSLFIIRPPLIYGAGVKGNLSSLQSMVKKMPITPFGRATAKRSYVSVHNVVGFIHYILTHDVPEGVYNVTDYHDLSTKELCILIIKANQSYCFNFPMPRRLIKILFKLIKKEAAFEKIYKSYLLSSEKALKTGWRPNPVETKDFLI